ncbi:DNA-binding beta-propeller fold protein YncE [Thermomonospora echinospora]|uniref:DNA-binding beta-propeller fold protein YncE n=1 Tax=Thermomonospora echinospora TaxID=1992 RepID=A0A1H6CTG7_9ACTN|nr:SMP-30/gluconolactonase/LRE family protein [Thermomonospora echinospora]SEG76244.1 DNA-binding beta-propeller fold protein YncE [Thermomonospora echinospora]
MDVYAHGRAGMLSPVVRGMPARVYVPNSESDDVIVFDQRTFKEVGRFRVGRRPQHVVPSWDLRTLWVNDNDSNDLIPIDPWTGKPGRRVPVEDPYNMYFTVDGRFAVVMAERLQRIDFRDARTMRLQRSLPVPCRGPNHADFSVNGDFFVTACEFSGDLVRVDTRRQRVTGVLNLARGAMPQDVKLSPDGSTFYVADMMSGGIWAIDAATFRKTGFIRTGAGAHGLYVSRDSQHMYVSNRGEGSISVFSFATGRVVQRWRLPGGGSPDMGGVSADGKVLWLSGRYHSEVYAISTADGRLIRRLRVGKGPHGLCVYPQPGRYSLGHTGVLR